MAFVSVSVPEDVKRRMDEFGWLNWSKIAKDAFVQRMRQLEALDRLQQDLKESKLTDKDCIMLGRQLRRDIHSGRERGS